MSLPFSMGTVMQSACWPEQLDVARAHPRVTFAVDYHLPHTICSVLYLFTLLI